jgi:hypothetical protein
MDFDPKNNVVKLCIQGMELAGKGNRVDADRIFLNAWNEARDGFEKFLAAYYLAKYQPDVGVKLKWLETALQFAMQLNNDAVIAAVPSLHQEIAKCYEDKGDAVNAKRHRELAVSSVTQPSDQGPFYHGTRADLKVGDFLTAGATSNYDSAITMNHIYFTALINGAGLAAALAKGDGRERVYIVEPVGTFENDPNVTNKKFPGNPTRSYRSKEPLKVIGEVNDWNRITDEELQAWRKKLANINGTIIN